MAKPLPVVGEIAEAVAESASQENIEAAGEFIAKILKSKTDLELVLNPVQILTEQFVSDLRSSGVEGELIAVFVDTFERRAEHFGLWLRDLLSGKFGSIVPNIVVTICGQNPISDEAWAEFQPVHTHFPLEVFSAAEATQLLQRNGIFDKRLIDSVIELTGRLPVLVGMLAQSSPSTDALVDPTETAVDRFLKWESDEHRRTAALKSSIPRRLNLDILQELSDDPKELADWLKSLAFVSSDGGTLKYHDVVRASMLKVQRLQHPTRYHEAHGRLAAYFRRIRAEMTNRRGPDARQAQDAYWYHHICAAPSEITLDQLERRTCFMISLGPTSLEGWVSTLREAARDSGSDVIQAYATRLAAATEAPQDVDGLIAYLGRIIDDPRRELLTQRSALMERAPLLETVRSYDAALADYEKLREMAEDSIIWPIACSRVLIYAGRYDDAVRTLDGVTAEEGALPRLLEQKARALNATRRFAEADLLLSEAIELSPTQGSLFSLRSKTRRLLGRLDEALLDAERGISLNPENPARIVFRIDCLEALGDYSAALECARQIRAMRPQNPYYASVLARALSDTGDYDEALELFGQVDVNSRQFADTMFNIGELHRFNDRLSKARQAYASALSASDEDLAKRDWVRLRLAELDRFEHRYAEAYEELLSIDTLEGLEEIWRLYTIITTATVSKDPLDDTNERRRLASILRDLPDRPDYEDTGSYHFNAALGRIALGETEAARSEFEAFLSCTRSAYTNMQARVLLTECVAAHTDRQDVLNRMLISLER
ncbi:tetratricopeptide repeat protein [Pseudonocardia oroxyli]|nr:tetratricopeptide repeat protein [Pseudonocardia oroxyli]